MQGLKIQQFQVNEYFFEPYCRMFCTPIFVGHSLSFVDLINEHCDKNFP